MLSPIALFVYNRPEHTRRTIEALQKNELVEQSDLFIYCDGPKSEADNEDVSLVREYVDGINGFKNIEIIEKAKNNGLAHSVITGVTDIVNQFGRVIVLEDDLITSPYFLRFMNSGLEFYREYDEVMTICGYNHPPSIMPFPRDYDLDVYFNYRNSSWGWGTWKDSWKKAEWEVLDYNQFSNDLIAQEKFSRGGSDMPKMLKSWREGEIDSWAIRWSYALFRNNGVAVCPLYSYVDNIGFDGTGTHCDVSRQFQVDLTLAKRDVIFPESVDVDNRIMHFFRKVYRPSLGRRLVRKLRSYLIGKK